MELKTCLFFSTINLPSLPPQALLLAIPNPGTLGFLHTFLLSWEPTFPSHLFPFYHHVCGQQNTCSTNGPKLGQSGKALMSLKLQYLHFILLICLTPYASSFVIAFLCSPSFLTSGFSVCAFDIVYFLLLFP